MSRSLRMGTKKKLILSFAFHIIAILALLLIAKSADSVIRHGIVGSAGANVYYDAVNGARHLWNRDNRRYRTNYHTVSGYNRFYNALKEEGFDVHVETYKKFSSETLAPYDVFFVGEQTYHAAFMNDRERKALMDWVKDGGGLYTLAEHTSVHYSTEVLEAIYSDLPVKVRHDSICDTSQSRPVSPTWVDLAGDENHPVTKGVKEFRFYNGASLDTKHGILFSTKNSWSDKANPDLRPTQNGNKMRDPGERSGPLAGGAAFEYGKVRVVIVSDHNFMSNPTLYWGDHYRFSMNAMSWLAGERLNKDLFFAVGGLLILAAGFVLRRRFVNVLYISTRTLIAVGLAAAISVAGFYASRPAVYDFLVHTGNDASMKYMTKMLGGSFTMYGQWTKEPQLRPWAKKELKPGYDALFLSAPTRAYTDDQLDIIDGYLSRGKTVVYLATMESLDSSAGKQLKSKFDFDVEISDAPPVKEGKRPFGVHGPRKWVESIHRFYVYDNLRGLTVKKGLKPVVHLTYGNYHIGDGGYRNSKHHFDVLSSTDTGGGEFWLVAPVELFTDKSLKNLYKDPDVVRQQMAEFVIRLGKFAVGDNSKYYVN